MEQRLRPVTYAESLEAKKFANETQETIKNLEETSIDHSNRPTSINNISILNLPSGGGVYPEDGDLHYSPLTFGEMKFLSVSTMSDLETINFFLSKIHSSFPSEDITYYDFYYIVTMIKLATFGELDFTMNFECSECNSVNKAPFSVTDLLFDEITVPLPIVVDLDTTFKGGSSGIELDKVSFIPITIGRFKKMIKDGTRSDMDVYISNCIKEGDESERLEIIKEVLNGTSVNLLETIDVSLFHGVQDLHFKCANSTTNADGSKEVCGRLHDIPFQDIIEYVGSTDITKDSLGKRIHFGI